MSTRKKQPEKKSRHKIWCPKCNVYRVSLGEKCMNCRVKYIGTPAKNKKPKEEMIVQHTPRVEAYSSYEFNKFLDGITFDGNKNDY